MGRVVITQYYKGLDGMIPMFINDAIPSKKADNPLS